MSTKRSRSNAAKAGSSSERMWDKMAWRSVDVAKENLGDYEDTVFFGLEELDGNAYKLRKTEQVSQQEQFWYHGVKIVTSFDTSKSNKLYSLIELSTSTTNQSYYVESTGDVEASTSNELTSDDDSNLIVQDEVENASFLEKKSKRKTLKELRKAAAAASKTESSSEVKLLKEIEEANIELEGEAEWGGIKLHILLQKALISLNFKLPTPIQTAAIPIVATGKFDLVGAAETGSGAYCRTLF
jgi:hypothetical protein